MARRKKSLESVRRVLAEAGLECPVLELPTSTRTSAEAAQAVGCSIGQIAKSIVFRATRSGSGVLVVASGGNRISEQVVAERVGEAVEMATPAFVREVTGFAIGGVPPFGLEEKLAVFIDEDLFGFEEMWAAAGTPHAVVCLTPAELTSLTGGTVVKIT
ncbi:MAG: YbaK/EbsC family protein [Acidobacteriota bacterium]|nr:YbaK/EbsC family protein [Acidobacteriota bacterium]